MILRRNWAREEAHTPGAQPTERRRVKDVTKLNRRKTRCSQTTANSNRAGYTRGCDIAILIKHIALIQEVL